MMSIIRQLISPLGIPPPGQTTTDIFDVILWNQRGEITESTIANIAVETTSTDGTVYWKTPALSCGLLAGTLRQSLLASGLLREGIITRDALIQAAKASIYSIAMHTDDLCSTLARTSYLLF
jgi:branched-subunit amino acid aminotransferase/4-amino-4-deoxychorismate lyase